MRGWSCACLFGVNGVRCVVRLHWIDGLCVDLYAEFEWTLWQ